MDFLMHEQRDQVDDRNRNAEEKKKKGSHESSLKVIATAATKGGHETGTEGAEQQRNENPERRMGGSLACLVCSLLGLDFRILYGCWAFA
ncbi:MAG: hypothetical protein M3Y55_06700 [Pseudomonadota bacterium]|nr:hypothetical protein [Pseudomonadota bacterium]